VRVPVLVEIDRGGIVESRHRGGLVVVDCQGSDVHVAGDPEQRLFLRSAIKPFVAALVVASGAADAVDMTDSELALAAASHSGRDQDVEAILGLLSRTGCRESDLATPPADPLDEGTKIRLRAAAAEPGPARQECSGEHAAMLVWCRQAGVPTDGYWREDHPVQRAIAELVARLFEDGAAPPLAIDACGVPTWHVTLRSIARAYAWLARPDRLPAGLDDLRVPFRRVRDAMQANPVHLSGHGQLDTDLTSDGGFVAKEGAEGSIGIGCVGTGLGLALTIEDGDPTRRAASVAALAALASLRLLEDDAEQRLRERHWSPMLDPHGRRMG
jgi:L-asparaginase II